LAEAAAGRTVSFEDEELILVDEDDREVGHLDKAAAHAGEGILHRAFSVLLFDAAGRLLLQRRAEGKRLWPGYWSNSCCSHPRRGESMEVATRRRLREELGVEADLELLYTFTYHASFGDAGSERELCWVFVGRVDEARLRPNPNEIADWRFVGPEALEAELAHEGERFTPWFKLEWRQIREQHGEALARL
jgi:isopentenyl-diphosphate delta-isomerase